ncbi:MAG TPA: indolepyruvate ferredoxin oxidoreductase subunit alpha [Candidatus Atribacteria bacterium]|nr:indolepyruvate ferredoxin oxidoreductase subunit alpha [Candidatus Atribacteria bacterium]
MEGANSLNNQKKNTCLMLGNEAIARGAYESGVQVGAGYPGTPSSEILECLGRYKEVHSRWCPNEKVALEVAAGVAIAGGRALATMKHVGLNVAADPLMTISYTGVRGGLVIVVADDPGMHSSQNEQDSRNYAKFAKIPFFEPADGEEARIFTKEGFIISEKFDTPIMVRSTTRVSHSRSVVFPQERVPFTPFPYQKDSEKYVMIPAFARKRRVALEKRLETLRDWVEESDLNRMEMRDTDLGIITGGVLYNHVREVFPQASVLKLGIGYPLPFQMISDFVKKVKNVVVVEELDPFWETEIKAAGIPVEGRNRISGIGEITPDVLKSAFGIALPLPPIGDLNQYVFPRPPIMCAGCPHRGVFRVLSDLKITITGDIGCYTLGVMPPTSSIDSCICMGASISNAEGFKLAHPELTVGAVIGDSTFIHSGIGSLLDAVYNQTNILVIILDNRITAMTGGQNHPGTGVTLMGEKTSALDLEELVRALGVKEIHHLSSYDILNFRSLLKKAIKKKAGPTVFILTEPCQLIQKKGKENYYRVDSSLCRHCKKCLQLGCPAIRLNGEKVEIIVESCHACGVCSQICQLNAIKEGSQS